MSGPSENPVDRLVGEIHRRWLWQVLAIYLVSGWDALRNHPRFQALVEEGESR